MFRKLFAFLCCLLFGVVWLPAGALAGPPSELRVVSWNIEWFPGKTPNATPEQELEQIEVVQNSMRELNPDIFIASEMRDWAAFEEAVRVVPGMRVHVVSNFRSQTTGQLWTQQVAIASRLKCRAAWAEEFSPTIPALSRGYAFAALEDPETGKLILVYAVHLKSNRSFSDEDTQLNYTLRNESIRQILHHMDTMHSVTFQEPNIRGWIFAGDFNTNHDGQFGDEVVEMVENAGFWNSWRNTPRDLRPTWRGSHQFEPTTLDYIFLKGFGEPEAVILETPVETSDHEAIAVEISLAD